MRSKEQVHYLTEELKIVVHHDRGYVPYYNLYTKEKFLFWSYWSLWRWSIDLTTIEEWANRWEDWE